MGKSLLGICRLYVNPVDVEYVIDEVNGQCSRRQRDAVGQYHSAEIGLELCFEFNDAGIDGQRRGNHPAGHIQVGKDQRFDEYDEVPDHVNDLAGMKKRQIAAGKERYAEQGDYAAGKSAGQQLLCGEGARESNPYQHQKEPTDDET